MEPTSILVGVGAWETPLSLQSKSPIHTSSFRFQSGLSSVQWKGAIQLDSTPEVEYRRQKKQKEQKEQKSYQEQKEEEEAK